MTFRILSTFSFLLTLVCMQAQMQPCADGFAGTYPCEGYDFVSRLTLADLGSSSADNNDIWGWTDPVTGIEYALVCLPNATAFVSLEDPEFPVRLGNLPTHAGINLWRDVKVYQDHAYIVADNVGNHGLQVFDLTQLRDVVNPPVVFSETSHFDGFGSAHNIAINEETGFAYVIGAGPFNGGPIFIDLSDPADPQPAGGFGDDGYTHDAQIVVYTGPDADYVGRELIFASNEDTFTIIDVEDKSDPTEISRTSYDGVQYAHQGWLTEDQRYYLSNDEVDELEGPATFTRTFIWDVLDLDAPLLIGVHEGTTEAIDHNMYVRGDSLYQANYAAGMRVLDLSDVAQGILTEVGSFDVRPMDNNTVFEGAWSVYPYFESGLIIINSIERGLFVVKPSSLELPSSIREYSAEIALDIYPNPASDAVRLSHTTGSVTLHDAVGRSVLERAATLSWDGQLDVSNLAPGQYTLTYLSDAGYAVRTLHVR